MAFLSSSGWHLDPHHFSSGNNGIGGRSNSGDWRPLNAMSAGLRRSVPAQLASGILQHSGSVSTASPSGSMSPSGDQFAFPLPNSSGANGAGGNAGNRRQSSRSFKEGRVNSPTGKELDAGHIQLYLKKRESRSSINGSLQSMSRPMTAESVKDEHLTASTSNIQSNIYYINPRPRAGSRLINVQPRTSSTDPNNSNTAGNGGEDLPSSSRKNSSNSRNSFSGGATTGPTGNGPASCPGSVDVAELPADLLGAVPARCPGQQPPIVPSPTTPPSWPIASKRSHYVGTVVWEVDDTVFCGGEEAPLNLNMLCRLQIEYIVDLSGREDDTFRSVNRVECPCLCPRKTAHARFTMTVRVKDEDQRQNLIPYFEDVVSLVRRAKNCQKCVLFHSVDGRSRAPAFIAAYLMHEHQWTRMQAINRLQRIRPSIRISDHLQRALMRWQSMLGIRPSDGSGPENALLDPSLFNVKRTAWT